MHQAKTTLVASLALALAGGFVVGGCVEQEPSRPTAADWKAIKQNILKTADPKIKVNADFEGKVEYLGLDVDKAVIRPGQQFTLTHYWKVKQAVPGWRIFVHLQDPKNQGKYFVNADHKPIQGRYPASMWKPGEIIRDMHKITLRGNWDAPEVNVYVGLWKGKLRLKPKGKQDGQNRLVAATLKIAVDKRAASRKAPPKVKRLVAFKSEAPVKIDGKLDDAVWAKTPSTGAFVDTLTGAPALFKSEAKVAWDDKFLYIAFENVDDDVWSSLKKRDDKLWTQEAVEVFIDANGDGKDYVELQVNPLGTIFDSYLVSYRKNDNAWNSKLVAAVKVDGTLNKRDDKDKGWTVEMAIPWVDTKGKGTYALQLPPKVGDIWRLNFFRMEVPQKRSQLAAAWSPPLVGDFHKLDRFGQVVFADVAGKYPASAMLPRIVPMKTMGVVPGKPAGPRPVGNVVRMAGARGRRIVPMALHDRRVKVKGATKGKPGAKTPAKPEAK